MKSLKLTTAALLIAATAGSAFAAGPTSTNADYGNPVAANSASRKVELQPGRAISVVNGETVEFTNGTQSFTWHFDAFPTTRSVDLSAIAPKELNVQGVRVYIQDNPLYQG